MNIIVCIKQVPGSSKVNIDEKTGVLLRDGADAKINPYDLYALETGLRLREEHGGTLRVITMGPPQAADIIREAYAMGADSGVLLTDRAFAGADVLATSYALSAGIKTLGSFDLIICGKQTTDGDTAQVGPELAEWLGLPHLANVREITGVSGGVLTAAADFGDYIQTCGVELPCLITADKDIHVPRLPSYKKALASRDREITVLGLSGLPGADISRLGLDGSPTRVERIYPPESRTERSDIQGAEGLYAKLAELRFI
jgi:electron transfer flavoprotein beta subunit